MAPTHLPNPCFTKKGITKRVTLEKTRFFSIDKETSSQCEQFLSLVLAEEVQGGSVLSLRDNVIGVVQDNMIGEVDDNNFNDPDYNLEEDDEDYHDVVF
ncbi:hypothetical protein KY290_018524 [Solanum tuberosum]|uniref:Uncharacterized protein n=1 Tax=Solanum tuberosum TaxID=4113 RepID=A0ABQ7VEQ0_SOLTU|nr:hypothetical protein KY290_018524 [Solanum tuberosum]